LSKKSASRLIIQLKVSAALGAVLSLLHLGALALLFLVDLPLWSSAALGVLLLASLYRSLVRHALRSAPEAIRALRWHEEEGLSITRGNGKSPVAASIRSRFVHPALVLLSLRLPGRLLPVSLVIAADALEADVFRRLRVALLAPARKPAA
jgi:toxin CptA